MQSKQVNTQVLQKEPLVSFIITTYNLPADMLRECIGSILALSLDDQEREIIVVDDGSDDSPISQLPDLQNSITYLRQVHQGLSMARNNGLRIAKGRYIQFVDGDDMLLAEPYDCCLSLLKSENPDIVLFNHTNKKNGKAQDFTHEAAISGAAYMHTHNLRASSWGYVFRKITLAYLQFTPGIFHEDEEFTPLLMLRAERVIDTNAKAYFYRERKDSIIHRQDAGHLRARLHDTEQIIYRLQARTDTLPEMERVAMKRRIAQLTMDYLYQLMKADIPENGLEEAIGRLGKRALFPLPDKKYTRKYSIFRKLVNNKTSRTLLAKIIR